MSGHSICPLLKAAASLPEQVIFQRLKELEASLTINGTVYESDNTRARDSK
jgi:hypothetical protein